MTKRMFYIVFLLAVIPFSIFGECKDCEEVAKGKIPTKYLDKSVKELPSGIKIWDNDEAFAALKNKELKVLWVDTRPNSFYKMGSIKNAIMLVTEKKGVAIPEGETALTKDALLEEIKKSDPAIENVTVAFFCQGPKCHRSYNAALRAVAEYGLSPAKVVWFRDGYPGLLNAINSSPKLKKKIGKYLQGDVVSQ